MARRTPGLVTHWKPRLKPAPERWPSRAEWRPLAIFTIGIFAVVVVLAVIDDEPTEPSNAVLAAGFLLGAVGAAVLLGAFEFGRLGTLAEILIAITALGWAGYGAVELLQGGNDPAPLIIGLLVGGQFTHSVLRARRER